MIYELKDVCTPLKGTQIDTTLLSDNNPFKYINGGTKESGFYIESNTPGNTVIVSEGGASCGYVNYIDTEFWCGCHCYKLVEPKINAKYLYYALKANQSRIMELRTGAAMPNIKKSTFIHFKFDLTNDEKLQNAIVSELDKIQAALDNKKEQLKKLDELIQSKFYEMFENMKGEPIELNKAIDVVSGLVNPNEEPYCNQYHIGPGNIISNTGEIVDCKLAKDEGLISNKYAFKKGMVLYSKIRPNLNKVTIPKIDGICSADMYPLIMKENVVNTFIWKLLSSQDFLEYAIKHSGRTRMPKLNRETLLTYKFILPPLPLQQAFAAYVEKVEQAKAIVNQEIAHLQELLNSRMDFYFRM